VKYSKKDLYASKNNLVKVSEALGLEGVGINGRDNKVNVYITPDKFKTDKEKVLQYIDEDMVNWKLEDGLKIKDKAYYLYPGERIERPIGGNQYAVCSLAFNGTKGSNNVGVTAGHCGNGTWYDLSDGTASIGSMSNAHTSCTYDAGSITYVSGIDPDYDNLEKGGRYISDLDNQKINIWGEPFGTVHVDEIGVQLTLERWTGNG